MRVYAGKDILTGGDLYLKRTIPAGPDAWAEAEEVRGELVRQVDEGRHPRTNATVSQLVAKHLTNAELERRSRQTLEGYARKHIDTQAIGGRSLSEGDAQDVQALESFYAELRRCRDHCDGRPFVRHRTAKKHTCTRRCRRHKCEPLSKWTVRKIHFLISAAYESAIRWEWIAANPAKRAKAPGVPQPEPDPPTSDQAAALVNESWRCGDLGPFVWLAMTTGARRGELCALRWSRLKAIHTERGEHDCVASGCRWLLDIRRAIAQDNDGEIYEKDIKTHQRRLIALDPETVAVLLEHKKRCEEAARAIGVTLTDEHYMFPDTPEGTIARKPNSWSDRYARCANRLGIATTLKNLRHYSATELIIGGVDIRTVAGRLGHSGGGTTTLKVYAAWVAAADQLASSTLLDRMPQRPSTEPSSGGIVVHARRKAHEELAAALYEDWLSGDLAAGTELTVKGLVRSHGVTVYAAHRAITQLKNKGVLEVRNSRPSVVLPCVQPREKTDEKNVVQLAPKMAPTPAPAIEPSSASTSTLAPGRASQEHEASTTPIVVLDLIHLGASVRRVTTTADPNDFAALRKHLLAAVRRSGGDLSRIDEYELVVHVPGRDEPVTTVVVAA